MQIALRFFLEGIMGYLLQTVAFIIGMHGVAKHKISFKNASIAIIICTIIIILVRNSGLFNFGVHTMLILLVINAACIIICKTNIRPSIMGSILMMILVLLGELINLGILSIFYPMDQINSLLTDPVFKAASAIPGNIVHLLVSFLLYHFRVRRHKGVL